MRIIAFINKDSGPCHHRITMPLMTMPDADVFITNNLLEEHFDKGCDIFIYNRTIPESAKDILRKLKRKHGFKTAVDVDDYWELDEHHILYDEYKHINFAASQVEHIKAADLVTTTHERLTALIQPYNNNVHVLPNAIPKQGQFEIERIKSPFTRLFWQGSITHAEDIKLLKRPIDCLGNISPKIKMVMGGWVDTDEFYQMVMDYTANTKHQYKVLPGEKVSNYYQMYKHADVCLIPLLNTPFNRMKSNLKVLEAANLSLPVICSNVHPYKDLPVLYANNSTDWVNHINKLVASKKRQKEAGQQLHEFCNEHFNFHKINKERKQVFENIQSFTRA